MFCHLQVHVQLLPLAVAVVGFAVQAVQRLAWPVGAVAVIVLVALQAPFTIVSSQVSQVYQALQANQQLAAHFAQA